MKPNDGARRLHPLTLLQRMILSLPALIFIMLPVLQSGDKTAWFNLVMAGAYALFVLPWIALYYVRFRYWITDKELVVHSGVITRRKRNIPVERIQNIEIEQSLLPRLLGTAKVAVYTAGSDRAEGVLEFVSLKEAREIREVLREMQNRLKVGAGDVPAVEETVDENADGSDSLLTLFDMDPRRVVTAGLYHFSLLYVAAFFSMMQLIEPDPTVTFSWLLRGPLSSWQPQIEASPWIAAVLFIVSAGLLSWISGVLITINKYYRFSLKLNDNKLYRRHGLMTLTEGTIPLARIQAVIIRSNPLMERFNWHRVELQTMGINVKQSGFQEAAPFARREEVDELLQTLGSMPIPLEFDRVSPVTIRRFAFRLTFVLALIFLPLHLWVADMRLSLLLLPLVGVWSYLRYRAMGYRLTEQGFVVRKGVLRKHLWLIPRHKMQTFALRANVFQRRLGVENIYMDTAGASAMQAAEIPDVPASQAQYILNNLYAKFQRGSGQDSSVSEVESR